MASAKKYTSLIDLPNVEISRCSQVLANRMQCWKAGDVQVEEELPATPAPSQTEQQPSAGDTQGSTATAGASTQPSASTPKAPPQPPAVRTYQLCQMHATINQRADEAEKASPTQAGQKTHLEKMLGVEQRFRTTVPPRAKEERIPEHAKTQAERDFDAMMAPTPATIKEAAATATPEQREQLRADASTLKQEAPSGTSSHSKK